MRQLLVDAGEDGSSRSVLVAAAVAASSFEVCGVA